MRKLSLIMLATVSIGLGGCATVTPGSPSPTPGQVITQAQQIAVQVCGFLPTVATITDIFLSGNAAYQSAEAIAKAICGAITPSKLSQARKRAVRPSVGGVAIDGKFVR